MAVPAVPSLHSSPLQLSVLHVDDREEAKAVQQRDCIVSNCRSVESHPQAKDEQPVEQGRKRCADHVDDTGRNYNALQHTIYSDMQE